MKPIRYVNKACANLELLSERLILRRFGPDDAALLFELDSDPEALRYIDGGQPPNLELDKQAIARFQLQYRERPGLGSFAAHLRRNGSFCGWFHFRPDLRDPGAIDLGYRLKRSVWGEGLAYEGARALIERGFAEQGVERVVGYAMLANVASWRVMEKLGMTRVEEFQELRFPGRDQRAVKYELRS
jgi:RimJ/RimL family protein N-acetyltransferase